jgi:hypothetical protein
MREIVMHMQRTDGASNRLTSTTVRKNHQTARTTKAPAHLSRELSYIQDAN